MSYTIPRAKRWKHGRIAWRPGPGFTGKELNALVDAMLKWQEWAGNRIQFMNVEAAYAKDPEMAKNCVTIAKQDTSNSSGGFGSQPGGYTFHYGVTSTVEQLIHELGHIIGLIHEHERPDAGQHGIELQGFSKMIVTMRAAGFAVYPPNAGPCFRGHANCSYDNLSIMHYPLGHPSWKWAQGVSRQPVPGGAAQPSAKDIAAVIWLYS